MKNIFALFITLFFINISAQETQISSKKSVTPVSNKYQFNTIIDLETSSVKSQGNTGTCWSFSTSSFLESEIYRISGKQIDVSEIYNVRATYSTKTWNYVMRQGKAQFSEGGLGHDVINSLKTDGLVPESAYSGLLNGATKHNHSAIVPELKPILDDYIKNKDKSSNPNWQKDTEAILDAKLGERLEEFEYEGKIYTPKSFLEMTGVHPDNYITITSFEHTPYYESFILNIPDNFAYGSFYNVSLSDFSLTAENALAKGYSIEWDGDVSEKTFSAKNGVAVVPNAATDNKLALTEIVPELNVTSSFRQQEFNNYNTTDDHLMHITGMVQDQEGNNYYKVKNSWGSNSNNVGNGGYVYMSESFFKLKSISIMVHKDALTDEIKLKLGID